MLERLLKYWPVITVAALAVVSVFNIGYFTILGLHFIGVMDLSNIVYAVGLVFGLMIVPILMFPEQLLDTLRDMAKSQDAVIRINGIMKFVPLCLGILFGIGLFVHRPYISITGLFAVYFVLGWLVFTAYAYMIYVSTGALSPRMIISGGAFTLFTIFWIGSAIAYHEAFGTKSLYRVTTKDNVYDKVRLARSSSSGFLIAQEKRVIYIPSSEVKSIVSVDPVDANP